MAVRTLSHTIMSPYVFLLQLYILHCVYSQDGELTIFVGDIAPAIHEVKVKAGQVRTYSIVNISRPNALEYDALNDMLYWTDISLKQIWARNSRTFQTRHIFTSNSSSDLNDLTVDASIGKIFYTDGGLDFIGTINTDGGNSEIIVRDGLDEPRAIVLHEAIRKMYWTDWGKTPYIAEADYNGSNIVKIVTTGIAWPNGLTIDKQNKVLYWCDAKTHKIEAVNVNGTQRRLVLSEPPVHYFDIFYINEDLFFTDWHRKFIMNVPSTGGTVGYIGSGAFARLTGLYVHSTVNVSACVPGEYGASCRKFGHCKDDYVCERNTGLCLTGCLPGYQNRDCSLPCSDGTYGHQCKSSCGECASGGCDIVNGSCLQGCSPGWQGHDCNTSCPRNTYGSPCVPCGFCADGDLCNIISGYCPNGCLSGWTGTKCNTSDTNIGANKEDSMSKDHAKTSNDEESGTDGFHKDDTVSSNHVLIIGAVAGGLVVLLILVVVFIVILIFLFRRKRPQRREQNTDYCSLDRNRQSNIYAVPSNIYAVPSDLAPAYATVENQQVRASAEYSHLYDARDSEYASLPIPDPQPSPDYDDNYLHPVSIAVEDSDKNFTAFA